MSLKITVLLLGAIFFTSVAGCSGGATSGRPIAGLFGGSDDAETEKTVRYAIAGGASVFAKASAESRLLGKLDSNERVIKIGEAKGFTRIRARGGTMVGWVVDAKLVRRATPKRASPSGTSSTPKTDVPPTGDTTEPDTAETDSSSDGAANESTENAESTETAESANAETAAPAAEAEPAGPQKPRGVGASVFDPY